ncbi:glycosyltransferase family 8 protein [Mycena belliarum]|uniref:Glycosyltransferase family 8 protein n=1 Tax=Mycena belliarum TaxID=1033014 RepID=A0AAD6XHR8_9AGAR|nr:glycosyltransferase family 8 protein [Mycena belliae]
MMLAFRRTFCNHISYELVESSPSTHSPASRKLARSVVVRLVLFVVLCLAFLLWTAIRFFHRIPYNPQDSYQDINRFPVAVDIGGPHLPAQKRAVVSSLYSDGFAIALAVVGHSARHANISARFLLPYLENKVSVKALCIVRATGWEPYVVPLIPPPHGGEGIHPRFRDQYTKLSIWKLDTMGIMSAIYLDADTLVRRNFDELFDSPFSFAAVPDVYGAGDPRGFSLTFNAGVLAFHPSSLVFEDMRYKMEVADFPLKQAEQAFLNLYFGAIGARLPYVYNANLAIKARSPVMWRALLDEMRIVHYTAVKPFINDARSSDSVLSPEEMEEAMTLSGQRENGAFAEEVGWWRDAYRRMMQDRGAEIAKCY